MTVLLLPLYLLYPGLTTLMSRLFFLEQKITLTCFHELVIGTERDFEY